MHEHVLSRGALDKPVPLRPVKPLHSTLLSHKETPFALVAEIFFRLSSVCPGEQDTPSKDGKNSVARCARTKPHQHKRLLMFRHSTGSDETARSRKRRRDIGRPDT